MAGDPVHEKKPHYSHKKDAHVAQEDGELTSPHTCGCKQGLDLKIEKLGTSKLHCRGIDNYLVKINAMSDADKKSLMNDLLSFLPKGSGTALDLSAAAKAYQEHPSAESKELFTKTLKQSLLEAKKELYESFNAIKLDLKLHGTIDNMKSFLKVCLDKGLIREEKFNELMTLIKDKGKSTLENCADKLNEIFYQAIRVASVQITQVVRNISEIAASMGNYTPPSASKSQNSSLFAFTGSSQQPSTQIPGEAALTTFLVSMTDGQPMTTAVVVQRILETTAAVVQEKEEEHKEKVAQEESEDEKREKEKARAILAEYPILTFQDLVASLELIENMPPDSLRAFAKRKAEELHPSVEKRATKEQAALVA